LKLSVAVLGYAPAGPIANILLTIWDALIAARCHDARPVDATGWPHGAPRRVVRP
jgi:hypothetical protein